MPSVFSGLLMYCAARAYAALVLALLFLPPPSYSQAPSSARIDVLLRQQVEMRDGIRLSATLYRPVSEKPLPTLISLTPYGTDVLHETAMFFAERGYAVVLADCRGRGNSEGIFLPFEKEGRDGFDLCNWVDHQQWCDGAIGMFGHGYSAMVQWLSLKENPPALKAIMPISAFCPGIDFPKRNNIHLAYAVQWLSLVQGRGYNSSLFGDWRHWNSFFTYYAAGNLPFALLDEAMGLQNSVLKRWLLNPAFNDYYRDMLPKPEQFAAVGTPVLAVTGQFDIAQQGTLYYHRELRAAAPDSTKDRLYLVVGPWDHNGTSKPVAATEDMQFASNAAIDMNALQLQWFDHVLKGGPFPAFLKSHVVCYETGANVWRLSGSPEDLTTDTLRFYLSGNAQNPRGGVRNLRSERPAGQGKDSLLFYPKDTTGLRTKLLRRVPDILYRTQQEAFSPDKLIFETAPLTDDVTLAGQITLEAAVSMNVKDTDLEAILYEVREDGSSQYISSDILRTRWAESLASHKFAVPDSLIHYRMRTFHFVCRRIAKGGRLRLAFGALNSPYYQKNYNSGRNNSTEIPRDAVKARITLHYGGEKPSTLLLPVATARKTQ